MLRYPEIYRVTTTGSQFCPKCNKIMESEGSRRGYAGGKLFCKDCGISFKPRLCDLKKVRAKCEMRTVEIKAIDIAYDNQNTVKFSTVDYFPQLIRVEFGTEKFIVERKDLKRMLEDLQLTQE